MRLEEMWWAEKLSCLAALVDLKPVVQLLMMTAANRELVLRVAAGLLTVLAASHAAGALNTSLPVGSQVGQYSEDSGEDSRLTAELRGNMGLLCLGDILRSVEPNSCPRGGVWGSGGNELSPLFPSSEPADQSPEREIEALSVPLSGAGAIPASLNGTGSGAGAYAIADGLVMICQSALQTGLPGESSLLVPKGPPLRWFRPPRAN